MAHLDPLPTVDLGPAVTVPVVGLGVYMMSAEECERSVETALRSGYRLVDTAVVYRNERAVGRGIVASGVPRDEVVVTTKLWLNSFGYEAAVASIDASLERLGTGWIDLMLLHQPFPDYAGAWRAMEEAVDAGKIRAIGVSNFEIEDLERLGSRARIAPVVNQIEMHPYYQRPALVEYLREHGIAIESWSPLGHGRRQLLAEPLLVELAHQHDRTIAQVLLRWHVQEGFIVLPKSTNPAHIAANLDLFDFELTAEDMAAIRSLDTGAPIRTLPVWLQRIVLPRISPRPMP